LGSKYTKNAFVAWPGLGRKRILGIYRAQGTCLVTENVVHSADELTALPEIPYLDVVDLQGGEKTGKYR